MADLRDELASTMQNIERYLMQEMDLFGNTLATGHPAPSVTAKEQLPAPPQSEPWSGSESLEVLHTRINDCLKCQLGQTRKNFVFGVGNPDADVMFIGEAPGADEDAQGEPFVGRAGQLLNKIIEASKLKRDDVYICNILKCRPPNNRDPLPSEMETCTPYLMKQIELVKPAFIICLGRIAAQWLLHTNASLTTLRGKAHSFGNATLIVTYHPAALLRNPNWKRPAWEDMQMFMNLYDAYRAGATHG